MSLRPADAIRDERESTASWGRVLGLASVWVEGAAGGAAAVVPSSGTG